MFQSEKNTQNYTYNFEIYRKPTATDIVIPFSSCHPISHKVAAFNQFLHRAFSIPLKELQFQRKLILLNKNSSQQ